MKGIKEKKLVYKVITSKDPEAFGLLYDLYVEKIYRFVYYKVSNKEDAEDVVSDVFLKAWNYLIESSETKVNNFSALVYAIARNKIIDIYRERSRRNECSLELVIEKSGDNMSEDDVDKKNEINKILKSIKKLKQEYQDVVLLRCVEEYSIKEIADILDKSNTNVRVTLHRAMKVLRKILDEEN